MLTYQFLLLQQLPTRWLCRQCLRPVPCHSAVIANNRQNSQFSHLQLMVTILHHPVLPPLLPLSVTTIPTTTTITRWCSPVRPIRTAAQRHLRRWWTAPAAGRPFSTASTCRPSTGTGTSPVWSAPSARWTSRESPVASPGMDSSSARPTTTGKCHWKCIVFVSASSFCCGCRHTRIGTYPPVKLLSAQPCPVRMLSFLLYRFPLCLFTLWKVS